MDVLQQRRESYARLVAANARVSIVHQGVIDAFATVPREQFLGPPPWHVFLRSGHVETSDPAVLYEDALVALKLGAQLNNGQPSLHMACLAALGLKTGDIVVHVGAGAGYYTAIIATLVGASGRVVAFEIDNDLAPLARQNLAALANVEVHHQSGAAPPLPPCDVIYVSAGATTPLRLWTDALEAGGRLLFPLAPPEGAGCMLLVTKRDGDVFAARCISSVMFTRCIGADDDEVGRGLYRAFVTKDIDDVRSLRYGTEPDKTCWFAGPDWWLSTAPPL